MADREGLRIECGSSISSLRLVRVMQELVEVYGKPEAIRLDNGPEMTSHTFVDWARDQGIRLMFIPPAVYMLRTFPAGVSTFGLSS